MIDTRERVQLPRDTVFGDYRLVPADDGYDLRLSADGAREITVCTVIGRDLGRHMKAIARYAEEDLRRRREDASMLFEWRTIAHAL